MNSTTSQATLIKAASILFYVTGIPGVVLFLLAFILTAFFGLKPGEGLNVDPADLGYIQGIGGRTYLVSVALIAVLSALEILAARWIGRSLKAGAIVVFTAGIPAFIFLETGALGVATLLRGSRSGSIDNRSAPPEEG